MTIASVFTVLVLLLGSTGIASAGMIGPRALARFDKQPWLHAHNLHRTAPVLLQGSRVPPF